MKARKEFYQFGISFRTAHLTVRELLNFTRREAVEFMKSVAGGNPGTEIAVLSTCNRVEFYLATQDYEIVDRFPRHLEKFRPRISECKADMKDCWKVGAEAARHLFRVACGLDSAVLGDMHILGQVREAVAQAEEAGTQGTYLRDTFIKAIRLGKQARTQTEISSGAASIGSALVGLIKSRAVDREFSEKPKILIIGTGEMGRDIGRHLNKSETGAISIINRTESKAADLADELGCQAMPWSKLEEAATASDIVIAATASQEIVLDRPFLDRMAADPGRRVRLIIDVGVPRNVAEGSLFEVLNIDAIQERRERVMAKRRSALPAVERIVEETVCSWEGNLNQYPIENAIRALYREAESHSRSAAHLLFDDGMPSIEQAEKLIHQAVKKILHAHVKKLRTLAIQDT